MTEHDTLVAEALRTMPVPDHRPGFWAELDARLAVIDGERRGVEPPAPEPAPDPLPLRLATGELPLVRPLPIESRRERVARRRGRVMAVAAVALGAVLVTGILLARPDGGGNNSSPLATAPEPTAGPLAAPPDGFEPTTTLPVPRDASILTVESFLRALANGETYVAWTLMSRDSRARWESFEAFSQETGLFEGYGAWGNLETVEGVFAMPATTPVHSGAQVITLFGPISPEGRPEYRVQPFATVYEDEMWRIDLAGSLSAESAGSAIELRHPRPDLSGVAGGIARGDVLEFSVPPGADINFVTVQIDGDQPVDGTDLDFSDTIVSLRPQLDFGTHVMTIAVVLEDGSFYTAAVQFVVE